MTITQKRNFGDLGEKLAARYLKNKGYHILDTNFQNALGRRLGEIDIIAQDKQELVFAEVKTRELNKYIDTLPEENITRMKLLRMTKIAAAYIRLRKLEEMDYRFDALSVWLDLETKKAKIKHIESL
ncbi:MAG: YraN family protein [Parcubacteria group bacterium]